jgi:hypothetical protein
MLCEGGRFSTVSNSEGKFVNGRVKRILAE